MFTGLNSTAHLLVCLRFNLTVTGETARLTADLPGWALVGRDLHPQDDFSEFHEMTVTSLLSDQQCLVATTKELFDRIQFTSINVDQPSCKMTLPKLSLT